MKRDLQEKLNEASRIAAQVAAAPAGDYRPTLRDPAIADAFDAAMRWIGRPERAWRGSVPRART